MPQNLDFSSIAPLQPMHDLLYNDLGTVDGGIDLGSSALDEAWDNGAGGNGNVAQWQFEGDFGNDSFWGFMNNFNP